MKTIEVKGTLRSDLGKKASKTISKSANVPCVVYGGKENINFTTVKADLKHLVYTPHVYIVNLDIDGKKVDAIMKDIQFHPVTDEIIHIDFLEVSDKKEIEMNIPVHAIGSSIGVKKGGKLSLAKRHLRVKALPKNLPDILEIAVDDLEVGQSIKVGDLNFPGLNILNGSREPVISVLSSRLTAKAGPEDAAAPAAAPAAPAAK